MGVIVPNAMARAALGHALTHPDQYGLCLLPELRPALVPDSHSFCSSRDEGTPARRSHMFINYVRYYLSLIGWAHCGNSHERRLYLASQKNPLAVVFVTGNKYP